MRILKIISGLLLAAALLVNMQTVDGQNPIIRNQFTADPTARLFNGKVYVFPSHDIPATPGRGRAGWFVMEDYHVFSSTNLAEWTDHGVILTQGKVNWVDSTTFSMWAPDCIERNGKYYFYFPSNPKAEYGRGFSIGVATADKPEGPYVPEKEPIKGVRGIDPNVFIDKDGQAYIYYSMNKIFAAKLKDNMLELASEPVVIGDLPTKGLVEGPFLFERNGIYYMTYPHVENKTERLEYATSNNPLGPFKFAGVIMDESPTGCWTNHHSLIEINKQWYLFYHHNDLSPKFDKNRSVRIDSLFFNSDGTIKKVIPTLRGVGITAATSGFEPDRFSARSEKGATIDFIDPAKPFNGWKTILEGKGSWISYNAVDMGKTKLKSVTALVKSDNGGSFSIYAVKPGGEMIAKITVPAGQDWKEIKAKTTGKTRGLQNLYIVSDGDSKVEVDRIRFLK